MVGGTIARCCYTVLADSIYRWGLQVKIVLTATHLWDLGRE